MRYMSLFPCAAIFSKMHVILPIYCSVAFQGPWDGPQAWSSLEAMNAVFVLAGVSYISALLGG